MSKKPNRQVRAQFYRTRQGEWNQELKKYTHDGTFRWSVKVDIVDHDKGYSFLDQSNHSLTFPSLGEAKAYADGVVAEVMAFLESPGNQEEAVSC